MITNEDKINSKENNNSETSNSQLNQLNQSPSSNRIPSLDLARVIAMLFMVQGHAIYAVGDPSFVNVSELPWSIWHLFRGFTAPMFLLVSGAVQVFANKRDEFGRISKKTLIKRIRIAIILILIGYILGMPVSHFYELVNINHDKWLSFLAVNILQTIGISLIVVILLFYYTKNNKHLGILSFIISITIIMTTPIVHNIDWFYYTSPIIASYFSHSSNSIFSLFPFTGYMLLGVAIGCFLSFLKPEVRTTYLIKYGSILGLILIIASLPYNKFSWEIDNFNAFVKYLNSYERVSPGISFQRLGFVLMEISLVALLYKYTTKFRGIYVLLGKRAILIYVIHLFIIYGTPFTKGFTHFGNRSLPEFESILIAIATLILSISITLLIDYSLKYYEKSKYIFGTIISLYLIWLFFI